jgi:hypothetical protein
LALLFRSAEKVNPVSSGRRKAVKKQALRWIVAGSLLISSPLAAEPLEDLQMRLEGLRNDQPIRLRVEVELEHRGSAPLHLNSKKKRGRVIVAYSPDGTVVTRERSRGSSSTFLSLWRSKKPDETEPLVSWDEAQYLAKPAEMLESVLSQVKVVSEEMVSWREQPARLLVLQSAELAANQQVRKASTASPENGQGPLFLEAKLWLDESGVPLALESSMELRLTAALTALEHQSFTFQQVDGRLLVAEAQETSSGTALAVLRSRETKKMKVTVMK